MNKEVGLLVNASSAPLFMHLTAKILPHRQCLLPKDISRKWPAICNSYQLPGTCYLQALIAGCHVNC